MLLIITGLYYVSNSVSEPVAAISSEQWADDMASAERKPIPGVWGQSPQRSLGADNVITRLIIH